MNADERSRQVAGDRLWLAEFIADEAFYAHDDDDDAANLHALRVRLERDGLDRVTP
jgi:hypothetical protein